MRQLDAELLEEHHQVAAPRNAHRGGRHGVFQHEVPPDNPGHQLAHGGVGIGIGTARNGNHRGKLGVAQAGKGAAQGRNDKGEGNGRAGVLCGYRTGDGEKAGTYNDAYTQGYEAEGAQHAAQAALAFVAGFMQQLRQWFSDKNSHSFFLFFRVTRIGYKKTRNCRFRLFRASILVVPP